MTCDCRDRDGDQKAVTSIEVTAEMIETGVMAFAGYYPDCASDGAYASRAISAIWDAMQNRASGVDPFEHE